MQQEIQQKIREICDKLSNVTYENLTKIIRLEKSGEANAARNLDDSFQNDIDSWLGGGTCFSMTWHLYQVFCEMKLKPRLVMGHKRKAQNIHCALVLNDTESFTEYLFDPGYMIFEPLKIPAPIPQNINVADFPLVPNRVRLERLNAETLTLWTGGAANQLKLRFEYPLKGVSVAEFFTHWNESFYREMMTYPVLNRLDREHGIQYYFQKGNLVTRSANGSTIQKIENQNAVQTLSNIFKLSPDLIERALKILNNRK